MYRYSLWVSVGLLALSLVPPGFSKDKKKDPEEIGNRDVSRGVNLYSVEKELALGREMAQQVENEARMIGDPVITEFVNRVGQNLVRNSDAKVPFIIKVVDSDDVNAFALPGGYMFVNTGLILKVSNEAELAGVLAHEIAHVAARHGTRQATRGTLVNYASLPLIFMGGWAGYAVQQVAGLAIPLGFLKFSRGFESEADRLGLEYLYKTGYDPEAFVDFFERIGSMERKRKGTVSRVFSTHPMTNDRIKSAQRAIQSDLKPKSEYVVDSSEFQDVQNRLASIQGGRKLFETDRPVLRRAAHSSDVENEGDRPTIKRP